MPANNNKMNLAKTLRLPGYPVNIVMLCGEFKQLSEPRKSRLKIKEYFAKIKRRAHNKRMAKNVIILRKIHTDFVF